MLFMLTQFSCLKKTSLLYVAETPVWKWEVGFCHLKKKIVSKKERKVQKKSEQVHKDVFYRHTTMYFVYRTGLHATLFHNTKVDFFQLKTLKLFK